MARWDIRSDHSFWRGRSLRRHRAVAMRLKISVGAVGRDPCSGNSCDMGP